MSVTVDTALPQETSSEPKSKGRRARWATLIVAIFVTVLIVVLATRPAASSRVAPSPLVGHDAPNVSGTALDGRHVDLSQMHGRYVVLNFFATWCAPCRQEHPDLVKFSTEHPGATDPTIVSIAYDDNDISNAKSFFAENGGTWPVLPNGSQVAIDYGVRGLPESFIIDPTGKIKARITGALTTDELNSLTGVL